MSEIKVEWKDINYDQHSICGSLESIDKHELYILFDKLNCRNLPNAFDKESKFFIGNAIYYAEGLEIIGDNIEIRFVKTIETLIEEIKLETLSVMDFKSKKERDKFILSLFN
jgi:hypothetical protein